MSDCAASRLSAHQRQLRHFRRARHLTRAALALAMLSLLYFLLAHGLTRDTQVSYLLQPLAQEGFAPLSDDTPAQTYVQAEIASLGPRCVTVVSRISLGYSSKTTRAVFTYTEACLPDGRRCALRLTGEDPSRALLERYLPGAQAAEESLPEPVTVYGRLLRLNVPTIPPADPETSEVIVLQRDTASDSATFLALRELPVIDLADTRGYRLVEDPESLRLVRQAQLIRSSAVAALGVSLVLLLLAAISYRRQFERLNHLNAEIRQQLTPRA